jgi:serine/threonine-protein phosphatase PGAM5
MYRGPEGKEDKHEFEVIVCHGNVIRYFFCRALQLPPEAWLRMSVFNCSITYIVLRPNGLVSARMMGDIGHLDYDECSFSMYHGLVW